MSMLTWVLVACAQAVGLALYLDEAIPMFLERGIVQTPVGLWKRVGIACFYACFQGLAAALGALGGLLAAACGHPCSLWVVAAVALILQPSWWAWRRILAL